MICKILCHSEERLAGGIRSRVEIVKRHAYLRNTWICPLQLTLQLSFSFPKNWWNKNTRLLYIIVKFHRFWRGRIYHTINQIQNGLNFSKQMNDFWKKRPSWNWTISKYKIEENCTIELYSYQVLTKSFLKFWLSFTCEIFYFQVNKYPV